MVNQNYGCSINLCHTITMKNSRLDEYNFLISITSELKYKYSEHNEGVLTEIINYLTTRKASEETTVMNKYKSNQL